MRRLLLLLLLPAVALGATDPRVADLAKRYELEIVSRGEPFPVKCSYGTIGGEDATEAQVVRYLLLLREELVRYPPAFIRKARLKRIVLCRGLALSGQVRYAVPDFEHQTLYVHIGHWDRGYLRHAFHHDFFHIVDLVDDGKLYRDAEWAKLNPKGFKYGRGGETMLNDPNVGLLRTGQTGFLNRYSTAGVEEDKAEIFTYLVTNRAVLMEKAENDPFIAAKVEFMKDLLLRFCPEARELCGAAVDRGIEKARAAGKAVLALFSVREETLADDAVKAELERFAVFRFDLKNPDQAEYAKSLGVRRAPGVVAWSAGAKKHVRYTSVFRPRALARWLKKR